MCGGIHHGLEFDTIVEVPDWPFGNDVQKVEQKPSSEQEPVISAGLEAINMAVAKLVMRRYQST